MATPAFTDHAVLDLSDRQVSVWTSGKGRQILFILPGYQQSVEEWQHWLPEAPDGWQLVLIGMPGSVLPPNVEDPAWPASVWLELLAELREEFRPEGEVWLGYSLGGRLLLHLAGLTEGKLTRILLMSPDGLAPSLGERLSLYHPVGQWPLRWLIRHPETARKWANRLHKWRLLNDSGHYFAMRQLREPEALQQSVEVVRLYMRAQPNRRRLKQADRRRLTQVWAIWGEKDRVRPVDQSRKLWNFFSRVHLTVVPGGHTWPKSRPDLLQEWLVAALEEAQQDS